MVCLKRISLVASLVASLSLSLASACYAADLHEGQKTAISQNCAHIKDSLIQLQRVDSRTRTYLGTAYESISSRFITPLNLRLVRLGTPSATLFEIQSNFTTAQAQFRDRYIAYMRDLENLIATDCEARPEDFYNQLTTTRTKREELRQSTKKLAELAEEQYQAVFKLRSDL